MASHGKNSPGKPKRYLNSFIGCGGHINGGGTVNGTCGVHPPAFEPGDSIGELMSSLEAQRAGDPGAPDHCAIDSSPLRTIFQ